MSKAARLSGAASAVSEAARPAGSGAASLDAVNEAARLSGKRDPRAGRVLMRWMVPSIAEISGERATHPMVAPISRPFICPAQPPRSATPLSRPAQPPRSAAALSRRAQPSRSAPADSLADSLAAAAAGSAASVIARTTTTRRAPASSTSARLASSMPPIANQGRVAARPAA